jgi:hypothetical protein
MSSPSQSDTGSSFDNDVSELLLYATQVKFTFCCLTSGV